MSYLKPDIYPDTTQAHREFMTSRHPFICAEGPARTSKTMRALRKLFALHFKYKGLTSGVIRTDAVALNNTARKTIREEMMRFEFDDPLSQIKQQGGPTRFTNLYLNDGEMVFGGMNRPGNILGAKYYVIFLNELVLFTEEQYAMIKTRLSGSAWRDEYGSVIHQIISDTNPDVPSHWVYEYEKQGLIKFIKFNFKDNAGYYRDGRWSQVGKATVENLSQLPKFQRDRYYLGKRVAPHGIVYDLQEANILDELPDLSNCTFYRAADWGMRHPSIVLWIAEHKITQDVYVFREWRRTHSDIDIVGDAMRAFTKEPIEQTITDNDENRQSMLRKDGIDSVMVTKVAGSIMNRVFLVQAALKRAQDGQDGGLYIYRHSLCNPNGDPHEDADDYPRDLIDEMGKLYFAEKGDRPVDEGDDATDALGYFYLWKSQMKDYDLPDDLGSIKVYNRRNARI